MSGCSAAPQTEQPRARQAQSPIQTCRNARQAGRSSTRGDEQAPHGSRLAGIDALRRHPVLGSASGARRRGCSTSTLCPFRGVGRGQAPAARQRGEMSGGRRGCLSMIDGCPNHAAAEMMIDVRSRRHGVCVSLLQEAPDNSSLIRRHRWGAAAAGATTSGRQLQQRCCDRAHARGSFSRVQGGLGQLGWSEGRLRCRVGRQHRPEQRSNDGTEEEW